MKVKMHALISFGGLRGKNMTHSLVSYEICLQTRELYPRIKGTLRLRLLGKPLPKTQLRLVYWFFGLLAHRS